VTAGQAPYTTVTEAGLVLAAQSQSRGVNLVLAQGAAIAGTIAGPGGTPLSGVQVSTNAGGTTGDSTVTDANGAYQLAGLPAGTYQIVAQADGFGEGDLPNLTVAPGASLTGQSLTLQA